MENTKRKSIKSIQQLSNLEFIRLFQHRNNITKKDDVTLKVDGIGFRFGKLEDGTFFVEGSRTGIITIPGSFVKHAHEKELTGKLYDRCIKYEYLFKLLAKQKFIRDLPIDTKIVCEFLYIPLVVEETLTEYKFINIFYDKNMLGKILTIIPLYSIGKYDIDNFYDYSSDDIRIISPLLKHRYDIDISHITDKLKNIDISILKSRKLIDKSTKEIYNTIIDQAKRDISDLLFTEFSYEGKMILGENIEGFVLILENTKVKICNVK
ncbi:MAG: hypothetical protein PHC28_06760 [Flavobacterium sp.]|uniref:hypothetical protein n=1 Tax=Flavobacterium sp. TaxID=239 RepID=UPI0026032C38|nr:hypothetical protein [Flavobacterium sp.]MDD5150171.1 hypothetical protein [Flavobacterium sp.]